MFGDIFRYKGDEYVYFVEDVEKDIIYAGKLLDDNMTRWIKDLEKAKTKQGAAIHDNPLFSYIVLSTDEFESRAVLCARADGVTRLAKPHGTLNDSDMTAVRQEIKNGPSPDRLKQLLDLLA